MCGRAQESAHIFLARQRGSRRGEEIESSSRGNEHIFIIYINPCILYIIALGMAAINTPPPDLRVQKRKPRLNIRPPPSQIYPRLLYSSAYRTAGAGGSVFIMSKRSSSFFQLNSIETPSGFCLVFLFYLI